MKVKDVGNGMVAISQKWLINRYIKGAILPEYYLLQASDSHGNIAVPLAALELWERKRDEYIAKEKKLKQCAKLNNKGKDYEKQGKIKLAIKTYEKNIDGDCYPATYSFDRLMVLYRKAKDYENELRVCEKAIQVLKYDKYVQRKAKILFLKQKQSVAK
jgi:tetratricopeptide (TPR) repeat protein